jgi:threonine dehydrogenase-like Zn-dependent dehydrogenase
LKKRRLSRAECRVSDRQAIGRGVATEAGAALNLGAIIAVDIDPAKLVLTAKMGAPHGVDASKDDATAAAKRKTDGSGVDVADLGALHVRSFLNSGAGADIVASEKCQKQR